MDPTSPAFGGIRGAQQAMDGQANAQATACAAGFISHFCRQLKGKGGSGKLGFSKFLTERKN